MSCLQIEPEERERERTTTSNDPKINIHTHMLFLIRDVICSWKGILIKTTLVGNRLASQ